MKSFGGEPFSFSLKAEAQRIGKDLKLTYTWKDAGSVLFPESTPPKRVHGLWEHTCFEAFWGKAGQPEYWEGNFSPSGEWNIFHFDSYRKGMKEAALEPRLLLRENSLEVILPNWNADELSLTAVIEQKNHAISYWAWKHASGKPDFHARETFTQTF